VSHYRHAEEVRASLRRLLQVRNDAACISQLGSDCDKRNALSIELLPCPSMRKPQVAGGRERQSWLLAGAPVAMESRKNCRRASLTRSHPGVGGQFGWCVAQRPPHGKRPPRGDCHRHGRGLLLRSARSIPSCPLGTELDRCVEVHRMRGIRLHRTITVPARGSNLRVPFETGAEYRSSCNWRLSWRTSG